MSAPAFDGDRGAGVVVASGAIAAAVLVTSIVFGASLSALVSTPRSYGWPWEVGIMGGYGYGGLDLDAVESTLAQRSDVDGWTVLAFTNFVAVDGEPVPSVIGLGDASRLDLTLAAGRLPAGDGEVALGRDTAAAHGVHVGDHVELSGDGIETRQATVTGLTVMPALGPFESDGPRPDRAWSSRPPCSTPTRSTRWPASWASTSPTVPDRRPFSPRCARTTPPGTPTASRWTTSTPSAPPRSSMQRTCGRSRCSWAASSP